MEFKTYSFRHAEEIFSVNSEFYDLWNEVKDAIREINDEEIIEEFNNETREAKSLSEALNKLVAKKLKDRNWNAQSQIFADKEYSAKRGVWRLDFAKGVIAIEVAFNHGESVSWNLLKPVLSSEMNHVEKAIQTKAGIVITATDEMKKAGGFDDAVGSFEKYIQYLKPLNNLLTVPMMIVGLEPPETFIIKHEKIDNKNIGHVQMKK